MDHFAHKHVVRELNYVKLSVIENVIENQSGLSRSIDVLSRTLTIPMKSNTDLHIFHFSS